MCVWGGGGGGGGRGGKGFCMRAGGVLHILSTHIHK